MSSLTRAFTRNDPLDDFFRGFFVRPVELGSNADTPSIKIDVKAQDSSYLVHAEIPGVNKEDINVSIDGSVVSISAERKQATEIKEGERVLRTERYFGKVSRTFDLGTDIDEGQANAKYNNGVLELTLPKKAITASKTLQIQ
ncbi:MAG TPA: Hsp20 family protein [Rhodocyclaceae bacterium]|jgi:HSP20 family protein|nr:Hsp20 family protein [Rhodocyclaceae bacterium]